MSGSTSEASPLGQIDRDDEGKFTTDKPERILAAIPDDGEPVITSEIADQIGASQSSVNYHLNKLADDGKIEKKQFHPKRVVWFKQPS